MLFAELRHLGGAVGRVPAGAGAVGRMQGEYLLFAAGIVMGPESAAAGAAGLARFKDALAPYATGKEYLNFVEKPADAAAFYAEEDYARLRAIRAAVDPDGIMVGNHPDL